VISFSTNSRNASRQSRAIARGFALVALCLPFLTAALSAADPPAANVAWEPDIDPQHGKTCISAGCHTVELTGMHQKHVPYLEGNCLSCHEGHDSSSPKLLEGDIQQKCLACHTGLEMDASGTSLMHPPPPDGVASTSCVDCHDPHESRLRNRLRNEDDFLSCSECHREFLEEAGAMPHRHDFFNPSTDCGTCHYAHQGSSDRHLRENVSESCLTCHDMSIQVDGRKLENLAHSLRDSKMIHGDGQPMACPTCHTPHGSKQPSLLVDDYPAGKYTGYAAENYALCWRCHDKQLTESASGIGATAFRDGDRNLHRVHVAELKQGRACHLCHMPHASDRPHLLREELRFKNWVSRFDYTETPEGGSCATPCHRPKEYRR